MLVYSLHIQTCQSYTVLTLEGFMLLYRVTFCKKKQKKTTLKTDFTPKYIWTPSTWSKRDFI